MRCFIICCSLILCIINSAMTVTISTPGMQRKFIKENCKFQWNVDGNFTTYTIQMLSTGITTTLGSNTNHTFDSRKNVITLLIWNIQLDNAGNYSLSVTSGPTNQANSAALLFVYAYTSTYLTLAVGRNPAYEGDTIELKCSSSSNSLPAAYRPKMYYIWSNFWYGNFRNISSGPALLQNGDALPGYSFKNDGKTLVITSVQQADNSFVCSCQEEGSLRGYSSGFSQQIYSKPYISEVYPRSKIFSAALCSSVLCYLSFLANPPLTSYSNWSFIDESGNTTELPLAIHYYDDSMTSGYFYLYPLLSRLTSYGNHSVTLNNSNGSITETFQVRPPGPPDTPTNCSVQYVTHSLVSLQWRCRWYNGAQQTVLVQLIDASNDVEVETQVVTLATTCYNSAFSTLFQNNIQPETDYEANIWSLNSFGSSKVANLTIRTPRRLIFETSPASITIIGSQAIIGFSIADSNNDLMWLKVACCVELTTLCNNQSYTITRNDNQVVYDILPTGTEYVFDFSVLESDGYTYTYNLANLDGVRVSRITVSTDSTVDQQNATSTTPIVVTEKAKANRLRAAVIVLAILFALAVLALIGCLIAFLVYNGRQRPQTVNDNQQRHRQSWAISHLQPPTRPSNIYERDAVYELPRDSSADNACCTPLDVVPQRPKENYN